MSLSVPPPIADLLKQKDRDGKPLVYYQLAGEIEQIRSSLQTFSPEEQSGSWAERAAFQFATAHDPDDPGPWNTYFRPWGGATLKDGTAFYVPDPGQADLEILEYWRGRALEAIHPSLKARYADLVWDFSPYFKVKRDVAQGGRQSTPIWR